VAGFPIREEVGEPIRVTFAPKAYAEVVSLSKMNLNKEICGVLAGEFCEDDYGMYVFVGAVIEGSSADQGAAHVTYTQETWNEIHERMEKDYRNYEIVGWYHTHPGFGVSFSDMDLFIQENFFAGRGQIAFVSDPLGGEEAICVNTPKGIENLKRFWVDDRQRDCTFKRDASPGGSVQSAQVSEAIESMEQRLRQTLQSVDALRATFYRFLTILGMMVAVGIVFWISNIVYSRWTADTSPPKVQTFSRGAAKVGGKWCWVGSKVVALPVPPNVAAALREEERRQFLAAEEKRKAATQPASQASGGIKLAPATQPAPKTGTQPSGAPGNDITPKDSTP